MCSSPLPPNSLDICRNIDCEHGIVVAFGVVDEDAISGRCFGFSWRRDDGLMVMEMVKGNDGGLVGDDSDSGGSTEDGKRAKRYSGGYDLSFYIYTSTRLF
ncbi:hypothetical protein QVD17_23531 [Tagetes erecta]|uniref:Uncharacterized protein n=1 Tax=Tagetes erecta TaxID=13708 RepID=A0AAD8NMB7_TARER|nr:hypothetical protein QVD17_23531 [Tagetes erecta]